MDEYLRRMQKSTRKEMLDGIEDARNGELSPHWQEYLQRMLQSAQNDGYLPADVCELEQKLHHMLAAVPQMSDTELAALQLSRSGNQLVYDYPSEDYGTLMQIVYCPKRGKYTAVVMMDSMISAADIPVHAKKMAAALRTWAAGKNIVLEEGSMPGGTELLPQAYYDSLGDALQHLFAQLRHPASLM